MKTLDKGQDKIKKISEQLRREILEPAQQEAQKIVQEAQTRAEEILAQAEAEAKKIEERGRQKAAQEKSVFHSSLNQAVKQSVEALKQEIENRLFNPELRALLQKETIRPQTIAHMIQAGVSALEKEGVSASMSALIGKKGSVEEVNLLLGDRLLKKLENESVQLGSFAGGAQVIAKEKHLTIDISDEALYELLGNYLRKDFRQLIFGN